MRDILDRFPLDQQIALTALALGLASIGGAAPASAASKGGAAGDVLRR